MLQAGTYAGTYATWQRTPQAIALEQLERAVDAAVEQRMSALTAKLDGLQAAIAELPSTLLLSLPESGRKEGGEGQ